MEEAYASPIYADTRMEIIREPKFQSRSKNYYNILNYFPIFWGKKYEMERIRTLQKGLVFHLQLGRLKNWKGQDVGAVQ